MRSLPDPAPEDEPPDMCPEARAAFITLYHQHAAAVYRYFHHQLGHVQDAEDLTATTFSTALTRFAHYRREQGSLAAWVFGVAHNCLREHRRRRRPVEQLPLQLQDSQPLPEWQLLSAERAAALHRAIRALPDEQREALGLRFFGGLRTSDVATVLGKSDGAVKMLVHRAVRALRDCLTWEDSR